MAEFFGHLFQTYIYKEGTRQEIGETSVIQSYAGFTQNGQSHVQSVNCLGVSENSGGHTGII